ncbi:AI-2E family transporter [Brucella pseudogrignonensis]|uniref:AI-2E family transporter n=1 Tax=Brucella pseudogrignonensis TaxID=419475 RepID=UPI000CFB363A|nr:AI-2E family transporter [Brucella pseudogrignonensis]MQP40685.1 AI-2E family transporter [Ochrobactrum sp. MYb237]PQZ40657.1 AI-2E family transporter [Brucella pseudogrignonensis]PRA40624.1 AI-2E family transporter [Brucella pseudogrignonensis]PRA69220.1 AI-2E family transporter [Brucella pseudogrignonensis]
MSVQRASFYILLALVTIAFAWLLIPYYSAVLWGVILALIFFPVQQRLVRLLRGRRNIAAFLSVLMCICLVIIPTLLIFGSLVQEGNSVYQRLSTREFDLNSYITRILAALPDTLEEWMVRFELGTFAEWRTRITGGILQGSQIFASRLVSFGQNTLQFFISFGIMIYLLFFLFRDGAELGEKIRQAIPLSEDYKNQFVEKFAAVIRATVKGNIIIALVQGTIGGVTFWLLGIEAALLWGVMMTIFSLLPVVGASLVWGPAAIWFAVNGMWVQTIILILVGVLIIGLIDNLLRPPLVGKGTRMPDFVVLISTIGGISLVGINGFVVGPMIAAMFIAAWSLLAQEQNREVPPQTGSD